MIQTIRIPEHCARCVQMWGIVEMKKREFCGKPRHEKVRS